MSTRWTATSYKYGYNPSYPFIKPFIRVITPSIRIVRAHLLGITLANLAGNFFHFTSRLIHPKRITSCKQAGETSRSLSGELLWWRQEKRIVTNLFKKQTYYRSIGHIPHSKLTWQWKNSHLKMYLPTSNFTRTASQQSSNSAPGFWFVLCVCTKWFLFSS